MKRPPSGGHFKKWHSHFWLCSYDEQLLIPPSPPADQQPEMPRRAVEPLLRLSAVPLSSREGRARKPFILLAGLLRQQHPDGVNAKRGAKRRPQQRQKSDHQAQHPRPWLALKQSPSQYDVHHAKYRQQAASRIKHERQKIEGKIVELPAGPPANQEGQYPPGDENRSYFRKAQNSRHQPQRRQQLNVPLHPSVGD